MRRKQDVPSAWVALDLRILHCFQSSVQVLSKNLVKLVKGVCVCVCRVKERERRERQRGWEREKRDGEKEGKENRRRDRDREKENAGESGRWRERTVMKSLCSSLFLDHKSNGTIESRTMIFPENIDI